MPDTIEQTPKRTEGDVNLSARRKTWANNHIDHETARLLHQDARYFLHQSLSTPCLNALKASKGIYLGEIQRSSTYGSKKRGNFCGVVPGSTFGMEGFLRISCGQN